MEIPNVTELFLQFFTIIPSQQNFYYLITLFNRQIFAPSEKICDMEKLFQEVLSGLSFRQRIFINLCQCFHLSVHLYRFKRRVVGETQYFQRSRIIFNIPGISKNLLFLTETSWN